MVMNIIDQRIKKLQNSLTDQQSILLSRNSDILYFSSFISTVPEERSAFCLVSKNSSHLLLQNFLPKPENFPGEILTGASLSKLSDHLTSLKNKLNIDEIFLDFENLNVEEFRVISKIDGLKVNVLDKKIIWKIRSQKDQSEINKIKTAIKITEQAVEETIQELKVGLTEIEVKKILENKIRQHTFCDLAFPSIIAFAENSVLPHHQSGSKKLTRNCVVLIDSGAKYQEYCADMTRTLFFKEEKADKNKGSEEKSELELEFEKILKIVKTAYEKAEILLSSKEVRAADLDLACRNYITKKGYAKDFIHTTGHGLGIDIHEPPSVYRTNDTKLIPGMVLTIEPGIYLEGKFGVRWENTVFYTGV